MPKTNYANKQIQSALYGGVALATPATWYLGWSTTPPKQDGSGVTEPAAQAQLTTALVSGTAYTTLDVSPLDAAIASGASVKITSGTNTQTFTTSSAVAQGSQSIPVTSLAANYSYPIGSLVQDISNGYARVSLANTTGNWSVADNLPSGTVKWSVGSSHAVNDTVQPTASDSSGYYYQCTTAGVSGPTEPAWPTTPGSTVNDDAGSVAWTGSTAETLNNIVTPTTANGLYYECTTAGTTGAAEPTWPTNEGATVADGTVTWTAHVIAVWTCEVVPGQASQNMVSLTWPTATATQGTPSYLCVFDAPGGGNLWDYDVISGANTVTAAVNQFTIASSDVNLFNN